MIRTVFRSEDAPTGERFDRWRELIHRYRPTAHGTIVTGFRRLGFAREHWTPARRTTPPWPTSPAASTTDSPSLRDVTVQQTRGGWGAMTPSWLPIAGEATRNVFYVIGCHGHGLAQAPYLGTLLADRLAGNELHDDLGAVWRQRPRFVPSPVINAPALRAAWRIDRLSDRLSRPGR